MPSPPITDEEKLHFRQNGYLLVRSAITTDEVRSLLAEVERLAMDANTRGHAVREKNYHSGSYKLARALRLSSVFDPLLDHPSYFGKLVSLMGPFLQLMGTEIFVRGPASEIITGFHTDLGPGMQRFVICDVNPVLQLKVQLFLTDLMSGDSGNFALIPGSHRNRVADSDIYCMIKNSDGRPLGAEGLPSEAIQILAAAGDVLIFPHSLWHAVSPNHSGRTRFSISFRYGQLALRPLERFDPVLTDPGRNLTPRQRRLLGDFGTKDPSPYRPIDQEAIISGEE